MTPKQIKITIFFLAVGGVAVIVDHFWPSPGLGGSILLIALAAIVIPGMIVLRRKRRRGQKQR